MFADVKLKEARLREVWISKDELPHLRSFCFSDSWVKVSEKSGKRAQTNVHQCI